MQLTVNKQLKQEREKAKIEKYHQVLIHQKEILKSKYEDWSKSYVTVETDSVVVQDFVEPVTSTEQNLPF